MVEPKGLVMSELQIFESRDAAFAYVAGISVEALKEGLKDKGTASLLLSGGTTPAPLYRMISEATIDWSSVTAGLVDERWVPVSHDASNARLVLSSLIYGDAMAARFIPMKTNDERPEDGVAEVNAAYSGLAAPDLVILGMGPDGHTASWFPGSVGLKEAMSPATDAVVAAIDATGCPVSGEHPARMTVTLPVVVNARTVILMISGDEKRRVLENADANLPIHQLLEAGGGKIIQVWAP